MSARIAQPTVSSATRWSKRRAGRPLHRQGRTELCATGSLLEPVSYSGPGFSVKGGRADSEVSANGTIEQLPGSLQEEEAARTEPGAVRRPGRCRQTRQPTTPCRWR